MIAIQLGPKVGSHPYGWKSPFAASAAPASQSAPAPGPAPQNATDYCLPRKAAEYAAGLVGGVASTAINTLPCAVAGAFEGVTRNMDAEDIGDCQTFFVVLETSLGGAVAGGVAGGGVGILLGCAGGLVGGIAYGALQNHGKGSEEIGAAIKDKVDASVSGNVPSGSRVKDVTTALTQGSIVGAVAGGGASLSVGRQEASGVVSGVIEGTSGTFHVFKGDYDPQPSQPPAGQGGGLIGSIIRVPRVVLRTGVGAALGVAGGTLSTIDGAIQGFGQGLSHHYDGSTDLHNGILALELTGAGLTAGAVTFGLPGAAVGTLAGLVTGAVINRIARKTGTDEASVKYVSLCVKSAAADDTQSGSKVYDTFRDGIEGGIVGTAAGFKAGVLSGYQGGKGAVDGVMDGIKGIILGLFGAGHHPAPGPPPQPAPPTPPSKSPATPDPAQTGAPAQADQSSQEQAPPPAPQADIS